MRIMRRERVAYFCFFAVIGFAVLGSFNLFKLAWLSRSGLNAQGEVRSLDCTNHNTFGYGFLVQGQEYVGTSSSAQWPNHPCDQLKQGLSIPVTYLPNRPNVNFAGDLRGSFTRELIFVVAASLFFPTVIVAGQVLRRRRIAGA